MASIKQSRKGRVLTKEQKQEKAARERHLLLTKEKILGLQREVSKVIESLLEEDISEEYLLENCVKLCQKDYEDVVQERSIAHLCGYPLCDNPLVKVPKQKYHISSRSNKVYDLTERKCFCSNGCYKASNYLKAQLEEVPLHLRRPGMSISIQLISNKENRGSAGEEIVFRVSLGKDEIEKPCSTTPVPNQLTTILLEDVKGFEKHLSKLKITENVFEKPFVFGTDTQEEVPIDVDAEESSSETSEEEDVDSKTEPDSFPEYNNLSILSNKHMPIPETIKKTLLIQPIKAKTISEAPTVKPSMEFIANVFYDWFTEDTMKYLLGERKMYSMKADLLFQKMVDSDAPNSEELASVKKEYIDLCLKMDKLQEEEDVSDSVEFEIDASSSAPEDRMGNFPENIVDSSNIKSAVEQNSIPKRRPKRTFKSKKAVSFAPGVNDVPKKPDLPKEPDVPKEPLVLPEEESEAIQSTPEPMFPLVDSISQNALRRQVISGRLKAVYFATLPLVGLNYRDVRDEVKKILETFSLTPSNITYKPKEWKCIALVILRLLMENTLTDLEHFENTQYLKLSETLLKNLSISVQEIDNLASDLVSSNQLTRFQGYTK